MTILKNRCVCAGTVFLQSPSLCHYQENKNNLTYGILFNTRMKSHQEISQYRSIACLFFLECKMAGTATSSQCAEVTLKNLIPKLQIKLSECQRKDIVIIISTSSNLWLYIVLTKKIFYTKPNDLITSQILE